MVVVVAIGYRVAVGMIVRAMAVTAVTVRVTVSTVGMAMVVEEQQANEVTSKTERADNNYQLGVGDLGDIDESLNGLHEDAEAKGKEEDTVDESTEDLCTLPAVREAVVGRFGRELDGPKSNDERHDIVEHVERVCNKSERSDGISGDDFDEEEDDVDH